MLLFLFLYFENAQIIVFYFSVLHIVLQDGARITGKKLCGVGWMGNTAVIMTVYL